MSKLAFSLIELIVVVLLIGLVSFMVIKLPSFYSKQKITILLLREFLYPNGTFYLFEDGSEIIQKEKNITVDIHFQTPEVYVYNGSFFEKKDFGFLNDKKIIFKYCVKNGIGDTFILQNGGEYYLFKPFEIKRYSTFEKAKKEFFLYKYQPRYGEYY